MLLLSTSNFKWYGLHKIFMLAQKSKYTWLDLVIDKTNFDTLDEDYIFELSQTFQVPVLSITAPEKWVDAALMDKIMHMANRFGTQVVNFFPPHITDKEVKWYLDKLSSIKKRSRLSICMQNIEQKFMMFIIPEYRLNSIEDLKKITWDTALNVAHVDKSWGMDINRTYLALGSSIKNIFVSDRNGNKDGLLPGNSGWGISYLPLESFFMKLKTNEYQNFITLKVKSTELGAGDDEKILFHLEQFKKYFDKHFTDFQPN